MKIDEPKKEYKKNNTQNTHIFSDEDIDEDPDWQPEVAKIEEYVYNSRKKRKANSYTTIEKKRLKELDEYYIETEPTIKKVLSLDIPVKLRNELFDIFNKYTESVDARNIEQVILFKKEFNSMYQNLHDKEYIALLQEVDIKFQKTENNSDFEMLSLLKNSIADDHIKNAIFDQYATVREETSKEGFYKWLNWVKRLPIHSAIDRSSVSLNFISAEKYIETCQQILDKKLFGLRAPKMQILALLHERFLNPNYKSRPIGWVGPAGIGKTTLAMTFAECEQRPFYKLSLSSHESEAVDGSASVWKDSEPGGVIKGLVQNQCMDGVFFLDEFEKYVNTNPKLLPKILELLDPEYNKDFRDQYIAHFSVDLSKTCFMLACNTFPSDDATRNRIDWINIPEYTNEEKKQIILDHILPKVAKYYNLPKIDISDSALKVLLSKIKNTDGIRGFEHAIIRMCSKKYLSMTIQLENINGALPWKIDDDDIKYFFG